MIGIYKITNIVNGNFYIGASINIERRFKEHKAKRNALNNNMSKALRKYGCHSFTLEVLQICENKQELFEAEKIWIKNLNPIYNMNDGGLGNSAPLDTETREKIRQKLKVNWKNKSEKEKQKFIKNNLMGRKKGYNHTQETREKLRKASTGVKKSKETIEKLSASLKGKKRHNNHFKKAVIQYDLNGNFIKEYDYINLANIELGIGDGCISKALTGRQKTAGNYIWKYKNQ